MEAGARDRLFTERAREGGSPLPDRSRTDSPAGPKKDLAPFKEGSTASNDVSVLKKDGMPPKDSYPPSTDGCGSGQLRCAGSCFDPKLNNTHCGKCNNSCKGQQLCCDGTCCLDCCGTTVVMCCDNRGGCCGDMCCL